MRKVIIGVIMGIFSFLLVSCHLNKIKFNVNEASSSAIVSTNIDHIYDFSDDIYDFSDDNQNLVIYKSIDQLEDTLNKKELRFNNQDIKNKYNQDFFKSKTLVIFTNVDSRGGFKYKFKSLVVDSDRLVLNITIDNSHEGPTVMSPRLFFIEVDKKLVKNYDNIVCNMLYKIN